MKVASQRKASNVALLHVIEEQIAIVVQIVVTQVQTSQDGIVDEIVHEHTQIGAQVVRAQVQIETVL